MATVKTPDARETKLGQRDEERSANGSPSQEQALRQCGRFTLVQGPQGFWWAITGRSGLVWYWHPETRKWIANCHAYPTEEEATAGLDDTLTHEHP
jgi:hypothetical protein